jgi:hypothetical protein
VTCQAARDSLDRIVRKPGKTQALVVMVMMVMMMMMMVMVMIMMKMLIT